MFPMSHTMDTPSFKESRVSKPRNLSVITEYQIVFKTLCLWCATTFVGIFFFTHQLWTGVEDGTTAARPPSALRSPVGGSCADSLKLSKWRAPWEEASEKHAPWRRLRAMSPLVREAALRKFRQRHGGRRLRIMMIGDSRSRIIFLRIKKQLNMPLLGTTSQETFPDVKNAQKRINGNPTRCVRGRRTMIRPDWFPLLSCDLEAEEPHLEIGFGWRPLIGPGYVSLINAASQGCFQQKASNTTFGENDDPKNRYKRCPDLMHLTFGFWYAKPPVHLNMKSFPDRVLKMRLDFQLLEAPLQRLSQLTDVIYRLDGPEYSEISGKKSPLTRTVLTINALMMETLHRKVPRVHVWTSSLAESLRLYHTVCLYYRKSHPDALLTQQGKNECNGDPHVGDSLRASAANTLTSYGAGLGLGSNPHCLSV